MIRILVFGASGFIGLNLIKKLSNNNNLKVIGTYFQNKPKIKIDNVSLVKVNLLKFNEIKKIKFKADFIIHLAAIRDPFLKGDSGSNQINNNKLITENISKLAIKIECKKIIYISSVYIYSGTKNRKFKENLLLEPKESLGKSKLLCEKILLDYSKKKYFNCVSYRLFTTYGNGASRKQFLEVAIKKINSKNKNVIFNNSSIKRDLIYIDDVTHCIYLTIMNFKKINKRFIPINLGYGRSLKIKSIVKIICNKFNLKINVKYAENKKRVGDNDHLADITILKNIFKWSPRISFKTGLNKMLNERETNAKKI